MLLISVPHPGGAGTPEEPEIEVFVTGDAAQLEEVAGVTVYRIGAIAQLQAALSQDLPGDPQAARDIVLTRFGSLEAGLGQPLENAARGLARAIHYGIDRVPAIVFDGQAVVYGITEIDAARRIWRNWKAQTNE
ncbi:MAG: TIGR03757 family integrating conjugative element protein [Gammaproteobacteria bacterium]|nr:TIGR03757 family integrating conjugative element protein [Gammaproteobacteria bacterium]